MAGLVFGSDLGLYDSSLRSLKGHFGAGNAALRQGGIGHHVNASTGNLILTDSDEILVGRGLDIMAERTYNSQGSWNDSDANGWRFGFERQLVSRASSSLTLRRADGSNAVYSLSGGVYKNGNGDDEAGQFSKSGSNYIYTDLKTGAKETYNASGYLVSSADADGNARTYNYSGTKLTEIRFGNSERMAFEYNASGGKLSRLKTYANGAWSTEVDYTYDSHGRLSQVKSNVSGGGFTTTYKYAGNSQRVSEISQSDGSKVSFAYHSDGKVASVTDGTGQKLSYSYGSGHTQMKDGFNRTWTYYFDGSKRLTRTLTPSTSSLNTSARQLDTRYYYDGKGHLNRVHNATTGYNTATYTYDSAGNRTSAVDAEGNKTEWRYSGKLLLSETVYLKKTSNPVTTRFVYDSEKHLRYTIDAEGRVTSNHYKAEGTLYATINYDGGKYNVSALPVSSQLSLSQMDSWRNGQNKALTSRTDYFYDGRDQLTETRNYAHVNSAGVGVLDGATVRTKFVYDQYGLLRQKIAVKNSASYAASYSYDGEGRVTRVTDANGYSTSTVHSGNTVKVTNAEGKITTSSFDAAGRLVSVDTADGGTHHLSKRIYNANGQLAMTQSSTGQRTYYFYDEAGRQNAVVSHDGLVAETVYNTAGKVAYKRVYWNHANTNGWFNGTTVTKTHVGQLRPAVNAALDRTTSYTYDKTGQVTSTTDAEQNGKSAGKVVSYTYYDSVGNVVKTTRGGRTQYFIYDKTGKQTGTIDAAGYLTENKYNSRGALVETIAYKTATNSANRGTGDLAKIRPAAHQEDRHSYTYYDGAGRVRATVNAAGELVENVYDEHNNRTWTYRYKSAITAAINSNTSISHLQGYAGGSSNRTGARKDFNALGQVKTTVDPAGITTTLSYNKVGQLTTTSTGSRSTVTTYNRFGAVTKVQKGAESTTTLYDSAGRKTQLIDGEGNKTLFFYDAAGRLTYTVNALGEVNHTTYDNLGQVKETRRYYNRISTSGLGGGSITTTLTGRLQASGADGRTHAITYNRLGKKVSEQSGLNLKSDYTYNEFSELTRSDIWQTTGGLRNITDYTYTSRGQRKDTIHYGINAGSTADDSLVRRDYDAFGNVTQVSSGSRANVNQRQVRSLFDEVGRQRFAMDEQGFVTEKRYNTSGQVIKLVQYGTKFTGSWSSESGVASWLASHAKSGNRVTTNTYDAGGRLVKVTDARGKSESYTYDANGNKLSFTNKRGHTWNYEYDGANRLTREQAPAIKYRLTNNTTRTATTRPDTRFYYDNNGNLTKQIEGYGTADARTTEYQFDGANRQTKILLSGYHSRSDGKTHFASGSGRVRQIKTVTYNALGLAVAQTDNMGSTNEADWHNSYKVYDRTGRVRYEVDTDSYVTEYRYSASSSTSSNVKVIRYHNKFGMNDIKAGTVISESMAAGRITGNGTYDRTLTRYFDRQGRVSKVVGDTVSIYDSSLGAKSVAQETQFTYNEFGDVVKERTRIDYDDWAEKYTYYNQSGQKSAQFDVLNKLNGGAREQGYLTEFMYNAFGQLSQKSDYARLVTRSPSLTASPAKVSARTGEIDFDRFTSYEYDALGRKTRESRWDGSSYKFYSSGDRSGATSKLTTQTGYDDLGNVIYETNAAGGRVDKRYDALGRLIKTQGVNHSIANGPSGFYRSKFGRHETDFVYSIHGDLAQQHDIDSSGKTGSFDTNYALDARGRRISVTNGDGITTYYKYDAKGNTLSEKVRIDTKYSHWSGRTDNDYWLTKSYQYDKRGNQIRTDINGRAEQSSYNAFGEVSQSGKAGNMVYAYTYNKVGHLTRKHQENGDVLSQSYDLQGRVTYQLAAGGAGSADDWKTYHTYNNFGFLTQQKLPAHKSGQQPVISRTVDRWGNVTQTTNALGGITKQHYNLNNQVVWEQLPSVKVMNSSGAVENKAVVQTYDYDKLGNLVCKTDGRNHSTLRMYDSAGLLAWEKNAVGGVTHYRYDSFGNKTHTQDAMGNFIFTTYNKRGLVTREGQIRVTQPKVITETKKRIDPYAWYGASGSYGSYGTSSTYTTTHTIPGYFRRYDSGLTHTYIYDQAGRRIQDITGSSDNGSNTVYTMYDANGNVTAKRTLEHTVTRYEYDSYNRKSKEVTADGKYQQWWYDSFGNVNKRRDLGGRITSVKLNAHKQVEKETNGDNVNTYTYWNNGALKSTTRTGSSGWDALARKLAEWSPQQRGHHTKSVTGIYRTEVSRYDYDKMGNRASETHSSNRKFTRNYTYIDKPNHKYGGSTTKTGAETFVYEFKRTTTNKYNERGQLVEVTSPQQAYSPKVLQAATSKYGSSAPKIESNTSGLQRLQYYYDEVGNRRQVHVEVLKSGTIRAHETKDHYYTYDSVNRVLLADATKQGGYKDGTRSFTYDHLNRRTREIRRDGGRYDHERYTYLHSSGQLKTTYKLDNSTSASTSATTYKQTSRDYDSYGRLTREYKYAISNGEGNSHARRGSAIKRTDYSWGNGSRLNKQTTSNLRDIFRNETRVQRRYGNSGPIVRTYTEQVYNNTQLRKASEVVYNSYDSTGNVLKYTVNVNQQSNKILRGGADVRDYTEVHTKSYFFGAGAQQLTSNMTTTRRHWRPNNTTSYFDRFGELMYVRGSNTRSAGHDRMLISNRDGQVLFRRDGKQIQDFYYANGNVLGESGTLSDTNFESHMVSASKMQQSAPGTYAVSNGDTLKGIAQKLWGDSSLWYLIADANSIEPTAALKQGMSLTIPTVNNNVHNNDSTFKPYNAADAIGKIDAEAIHVPPPSNHGCATMIVAIVVIVVAAVVTYGASLALTAPAAAGGAAAGGAGLSASGAMLAGAAGAAAGNAAGQLVGMALGVQDGFDLGGVFKAGARGALAAGIGAVANEMAGITNLNEASIGQIAARSAVQAGGNYLTNAVLEGDSNFSWKSLAANVAGSMAGHYAGEAISGGEVTASQQFTRDMASSFAGGYTENVAREWMDIGGKRGFENIAVDAFGNALGNSVVRAHKKVSAENYISKLAKKHGLTGEYGKALEDANSAYLLSSSGAGAAPLGSSNDVLVMGVEAMAKVGDFAGDLSQALADNPWLVYGLDAVELAMGPVKFAAGKALEYGLGDYIDNLASEGFNVVANKLSALSGIEKRTVAQAAVGTVFLGVAAVGFRKAVSALPDLMKSSRSFMTRVRGGAPSATSTSTRERVLANIEASQNARSASNFEIHLAKSDQVKWNYLPDEWSLGSLKGGEQVLGGLPGQSSYYTTFDTLAASGNSRDTLFKSLQVSPHPEFGYRPKVGVYEVQQDLFKIPTGTVRANVDLGPGGGEQYWIREYQDTLKLIREIDLGQ